MDVPVVHLPTERDKLRNLKAGCEALLWGTVFTARDQAHARMVEAIFTGKDLPIEIDGQFIYYAGPTPPPPGSPAGSLGPTTSSRMDPFTPHLLEKGLAGAIGKGPRSPETREAFLRHRAVYLIAVGGAAALLGSRVKEMELVAYPDLGAEGIYRLQLRDFPVLVAYDVFGGDIFSR